MATESSVQSEVPNSTGQTIKIGLKFSSLLPLATLFVLLMICIIAAPNFLSVINIMNIFRQASVLLIVALGCTFIISMGSIDLSFGSVVGLSGAITAMAMANLGTGIFVAVLLGMLVGVVCGFINGVIFAYVKVPSFLATLGTMFAMDGIALMLLKGSAVPVNSKAFLDLARGTLIGSIPNIALWALAIYAITIFVAFKTRFGRYIFAIGGGELVAKMSGVPVNRFKLYSFIVTGLLSGFAGALFVARIGAATPRMGENLLLDAIAAVIIGGTALTGGVGGPQLTLIGVLIISVLGNGMNLLDVDPYLQIVVKGVVVILAVAVGLDRKKISIMK